MIRTRLKLAATLTVVVLALTGFQTGRGGHGSHGGSSDHGKSDDSGGGCSTSSKKNHYDDDDDDYGSGSGSDSGNGDDSSSSSPSPTASVAPDVEVVVVDCVKPAEKKRKNRAARKADTTATVRVKAKPGVTGLYRVALTFQERENVPVDSGEILVSVDGTSEKLYDVKMKNPGSVDKAKICTVGNVWEDETATTSPAQPR
ncbi:hypothetical protein SLA_3155 [Streptomyces laurentii]|uniref:Secreted protein n=1 Tax=Streptomyces laurentii TaxID=39478 RepID=A0A160NYR0_STRLU|nr:hypothetical protein SLA_3155 [Streptomyces laurentii]